MGSQSQGGEVQGHLPSTGQVPRDSECGPSTEEGLVQPSPHYLTLRQFSLALPRVPPQLLGALPCPKPLTMPGSHIKPPGRHHPCPRSCWETPTGS